MSGELLLYLFYKKYVLSLLLFCFFSITLSAKNDVVALYSVSKDTLHTVKEIKLISVDSDPTAFITTWKTDNPGASNNTSITIPTNSSYTYNYDIDWDNDGAYDDIGVTGNITHDYGTAGTYTIAIRGAFPTIYFNDTDDKDKIINIDQWGDIDWKVMSSSFSGCSNLKINATDVPNLDNVSNFNTMFSNASSLTGESFKNWNISYPLIGIDMRYMFFGCILFNEDISGWKMTNVTKTSGMFAYAAAFNQDISKWNMSNVSYMDWMFSNTDSFNQDIGGWNVSSAINMDGMFQFATSFNQDISNWDVSKVTTMSQMFQYSEAFNQDLSNWDIRNVFKMTWMFYKAKKFNQSLGTWGSKFHPYVVLSNMLGYSGLSIRNYDATLKGFNAGGRTRRSLGAAGLNYCLSEADRVNLISSTKSWTITDAGKACYPEIDVRGNDISIESGDTTPSIDDDTDFGNMNFIKNVTKTFTIYNLGGEVLNLTGTPFVTIEGANPEDFEVTVQPESLIEASESTTFTIKFKQTGLGLRTAIVSIGNNDTDENPYTFTIQGMGRAFFNPTLNPHLQFRSN